MLSSILIKKKNKDYNVRILERNDRVGKKLLATGNGRCNYTNLSLTPLNFHTANRNFPNHILNSMDNKDIIELFKSLGIFPTSESDGRVFPLSLQGSSLLDYLRIHMDRLGIEIIYNEKITSVKKENNKFIIQGNKKYYGDKLIIATGGMAMPASGSDGSGYDLAKSLGHSIIPVFPTIVQLKSDYKRLKAIKGVRVNTDAILYVNEKPILGKSGDVLFTDYGLSGPAILDLSRKSIENLIKENHTQIGVNLVGVKRDQVEEILKSRVKTLNEFDKNDFFNSLIHKKLIPALLESIDSKYGRNWHVKDIHGDLFNLVINELTDFRFNITGHKEFKEAQSTAGGVNTLELNRTTLESKIIKNLYFTGEVLDVDGDCGGYNLQWAWSSAYAVSNAIGK